MNALRRVDKERAMAVAYAAGLRPAHHRTSINAAAILGPDWAVILRRLEAARRFRNETLYGDVPTASDAQLGRLAGGVTRLVGELQIRIRRRRTGRR